MSDSRDDGRIGTRVLTAVSIKAVIECVFVVALVTYGATRTFHPFQRGALDLIGPDRVAGWAYDPTDSAKALRVQLFIDGALLGETEAREVRLDLVSAGAAAQPEHGFTFDLKKGGITAGTHHAQVYAVRSSLGGSLSLVPILKEPVPFEVP
jgi:hypothetical protein